MPGPIPQRSDQRRRRNKVEGLTKSFGAVSDIIMVPDPDANWHPIALEWFMALRESGQSMFYEPSDWVSAKVAAELLSRELNKGQKINGQMITAWKQMADELLTTEGARRRAHMELERMTADLSAEQAKSDRLAGYLASD